MNEEVMKEARNFFNVVKEHCDHNTVSAKLFINYQGFELTFESKEHNALNHLEMVHMRNIKGEWV